MSAHATSEQLRRVAAGELSPAEQEAVEAHVNGCSFCQEELARLLDEEAQESVEQLLPQLGPLAPATAVTGDFLGRLQDHPPTPDVPKAEAGSLGHAHIPDYELLHFIGAGGFGEVWLAQNRLDGHFFAVKVIPKSCSVELDGVRLYRQRANDHSHLVPILHVGEREEFDYYVMQLAEHIKEAAVVRPPEQYEAMTLQRHLANQGSLPLNEVLAVADRLLVALDHLHAGGVIHCDVKPSNVLRLHGNWQLGDLGLM